MRILLPASLLLLVGGCAAQSLSAQSPGIQKAQFWEFMLIAAIVGTTVYSTETAKSERKKAESAAKEMQQERLEAQSELAGEHRELTEKQMELQIGQRQIELLSNLYLEQDRREPRILTLPASREPPGIIDRINLWMDQALRA